MAAKTAKKSSSGEKRSCIRSPEEKKGFNAYMRASYHDKSAAEKAIYRWKRLARPPTPRKGSVRGQVKRNVDLAMAYCDWSDLDEVLRMYIAAAAVSELTGEVYELGHSVPLSHPLVCGLHTHTNIEVITRDENRVRSNLAWPDMWAYDGGVIDLLDQVAHAQQGDRLQAANDGYQKTTRAAA